MIRTDGSPGNRHDSLVRQGAAFRAEGCHESFTYESPHQPSLQPEQEHLTTANSLPPAKENRGEKTS